VLDEFEFFHAFVIRNVGGFHAGDFLGLDDVDLAAEDRLGVFDDRFAEREDVEGVVGRLAVELGERVDEVERERLMEREVVLEADVDAEFAAGGRGRNPVDDLAIEERAEQLPGAAAEGFFCGEAFRDFRR
jgi:hypothetical protein